MPMRNFFIAAALATTLAGPLVRSANAQEPSFTLKYGVLAGLTGDPAPSGQAWNASAKIAIDYIAETLGKMKLNGIKVER